MSQKVVDLGTRANDARMMSVEQMLRQALEAVQSGEVVANKGIVIFLNDTPEDYGFESFCAQLSGPEVIALLRVVSCQREAFLAGLIDDQIY